jgi:transposase
MISVSPKHRVFLAIAPIDFRKGLDAISRLCRQQFQIDPMCGHYFIFCNKRKTDIKLLYYDSQGFCLFQKRLSTGRFSYWPKNTDVLVTLSPVQLQVLIAGGDPLSAKSGEAWKSIL